MRGLLSFLPLKETLYSSGHQTGGQQGALDRVRWLAGQEHLFDVVYLGTEEVGQGCAVRRHGQVHLSGQRCTLALKVGGEVEILHQAVHQDHGRFEAIHVLVLVGNGIFDKLLHLVQGWEDVVEARSRGGEGVTAAEGCLEELGRPEPLMMGLPEEVATVGLQPLDALFTTFAAFHHALDGLQSVDVVAVDTAVCDAQSLPNAGAQGHVDGRGAPGDRQGRAGHECKTHLLRDVVHLPGPIPVPRQVFVVEDGGGLAGSSEDSDDLLEELVARVEVLAFFIGRIAAVLADQKDAIDR